MVSRRRPILRGGRSRRIANQSLSWGFSYGNRELLGQPASPTDYYSHALGKRSKGITVELNDEYDLQSLFLISVKPWLPDLAREEVTVHYDGQDKSADFSLLDSQIVIEMKHVKDTKTKAAVAKTLSGLATFYKRNANVRELLFAVLVEPGLDLDDHKWEVDFSSLAQSVNIRTIILHRPKD